MTFNRNNFITLNGCRLFTAKDVCDIVRDELKAERERVLEELWKEMFRDTSMRFINDTYRMHSEWYDAIQKLRREP